MKLYVEAFVEFEISKQKGGTPLRVKRDEEGMALHARLMAIAKAHADGCIREIERVLQEEDKQGRLFEPKSLLFPRKGI